MFWMTFKTEIDNNTNDPPRIIEIFSQDNKDSDIGSGDSPFNILQTSVGHANFGVTQKEDGKAGIKMDREDN